MKAQRNIPESTKPPQVASQPDPPEPLYKGLTLIEELVPFLGASDTQPSADDCENLNRNAFLRAKTLLELVAWGEESFTSEVGSSVEPCVTHAAEGIQLQLEIMRLTLKTMSEIFPNDRWFEHKQR